MLFNNYYLHYVMSLRITLCLAIVVAKTPDVQKWMLNLAGTG